MNLYNILSINGIDIDEYLNGGSTEDINEIKSNVININNVLTYNMTSFKNNIRYFDSNYTSILNNYMINNCSDICVSYEVNYTELMFNSTKLYNSMTNFVDAFKLNDGIDMCVFNNCLFSFFNMYTVYTSVSEPYDLDFEYKTLIISNNNYSTINCFSYLINSTYTLDNVKIYHSSTLIETYNNAWHHYEHIIENCNALSFSLTANLHNSGNISYNPVIKSLKINECSIILNFNGNFVCDYVFSDCTFETLYLLYYRSLYENEVKLHIYTMFSNCMIGDLYLFSNENEITIDNFIDYTNKITKNIYINGQNTDTLDYVNNYKITGDLINKIKTFTTYNILDNA